MKLLNQSQIRQAIHDVLIGDWDPLSVRDNTMTRDEYDSYISGIQRLLENGADEHRLSSHLNQLETVSMGLSTVSGRSIIAAPKLLAIC